ncbi:hypothetical protein M408DRAFT_330501 [Serendipita vermifera MAFF 305830]|uniref:Uncharacterized protein n=1 Tax=Serendipita vermifera MAFF 305830 TaxID=933852 RepID=A0A0C3B2W5_SERVB|nr:hypothetical protein M408DRAFT_330501 [Serendipita vermifera MAFF 305830]
MAEWPARCPLCLVSTLTILSVFKLDFFTSMPLDPLIFPSPRIKSHLPQITRLLPIIPTLREFSKPANSLAPTFASISSNNNILTLHYRIPSVVHHHRNLLHHPKSAQHPYIPLEEKIFYGVAPKILEKLARIHLKSLSHRTP